MKIKDLAYFGWQIGRMHLQSNYRVPLCLYIVLTNRCNNHCLYCRTHDLPQDDKWTTENLKSVILEMKRCGTRRIHLTGGEPMLRSDIGQLITYAKKLGFFVSMVTNGYQVSKRIEELKDIDVVFLSYDGPPEVHGQLRGKKNTEEVKSALFALKSSGVRVWTTTVLTKLNADFIEEIVKFAEENNILANFNPLEFTLDPSHSLHPYYGEIKDLILTDRERRNAFQKLIDLKLSGSPIGSSLSYLRIALGWFYNQRTISPLPSKYYRCWAGKAWGHLDFDGKLYSCGWDMLRNKTGISVLDKGFESAWNKLNFSSDCNSCSHACGVENNLIFSLKFPAIWNGLKHLSF
ncbi:MAG: radical SAM protein [Candidatus Omnitrophica bacterium]|nr:radical SAM protein [Candidatus Omnitrophota bacterium]